MRPLFFRQTASPIWSLSKHPTRYRRVYSCWFFSRALRLASFRLCVSVCLSVCLSAVCLSVSLSLSLCASWHWRLPWRLPPPSALITISPPPSPLSPALGGRTCQAGEQDAYAQVGGGAARERAAAGSAGAYVQGSTCHKAAVAREVRAAARVGETWRE